MDSHWQEELLALVARYGEACAQLAVERQRGRRENPPADQAGAWAAILTHVAQPRHEAAPLGAAGTQA